MKRLPDTDRLESQLVAIGRRHQAQRAHRALLRLLTASCFLFLAVFAADYLTRFPYPLRVGLVAGGLFYALFWFRRQTAGFQPLDPQAVSLLVERSQPGLQSRLISTLQFQRRQHLDAGTSANLVMGLVNQTFDLLGRFRLDTFIDTAWRWPTLRKLVLAGGLVAVIAWAIPEETLVFCRRLVFPHATYPTMTQIRSIDHPEQVAIGDPFTIRVEGAGRLPELGRVLLIADDRSRFEYDLHPEQSGSNRYRADLAALSQGVEAYIQLGDAHAEPIRFDPLPRPHLEAISVSVQPPAYTGQEARVEQTGNVRALEGSTLQFSFTTSHPCSHFAMVPTVDEADPLPPAESDDEGSTWTVSLEATDSLGFTLEMTDAIGLDARDIPQYRITVIRDRAPVIRIERPRGASEMAPVSRIPLLFTVTDDIGIKSLRIEYLVESSEIHQSVFEDFTPQRTQQRQLYRRIDNINATSYRFDDWWENARTGARPGQTIRFWIIAEDNSPQGHISESDEQVIRVISSAEYRRLLWTKLGEHIERVDEMVPELRDSGRVLDGVREDLEQ